MSAISKSPASMAATACPMCASKEEPPIFVVSVYFGLIPRYSASIRFGDQAQFRRRKARPLPQNAIRHLQVLPWQPEPGVAVQSCREYDQDRTRQLRQSRPGKTKPL